MSALRKSIPKHCGGCLRNEKVVYGYEVIRTVPEYLKALNVKSQIPDIKFYSDEETVSLIVKERKSLSRFGDGEFMWMSGESMVFVIP